MSYSVTGPVTLISCPHEHIPPSPPRVHDFLKPLPEDSRQGLPAKTLHPLIFGHLTNVPALPVTACLPAEDKRDSDKFLVSSAFPSPPHCPPISGFPGVKAWSGDTFGDKNSDNVCLFLQLRNSVLTIGETISSTDAIMTSRTTITRNRKHEDTERDRAGLGACLADPTNLVLRREEVWSSVPPPFYWVPV